MSERDPSIAALIAEIRARVKKRQAPTLVTCQQCGKKREQARFVAMPSGPTLGPSFNSCECGGALFTTVTIGSDEPSADEDVLTLLELLESAASALTVASAIWDRNAPTVPYVGQMLPQDIDVARTFNESSDPRAMLAFIKLLAVGRPHRIQEAAASALRSDNWLVQHLTRQSEFSQRTFGPGVRTAGVVDHIRKELREIEAKPHDLSEWIDVVILGFDGAWRAGYSPKEIVAALEAKQAKNEARQWPDWRTAAPDKAIEHVRSDSPADPAASALRGVRQQGDPSKEELAARRGNQAAVGRLQSSASENEVISATAPEEKRQL